MQISGIHVAEGQRREEEGEDCHVQAKKTPRRKPALLALVLDFQPQQL